MSYQKNDLNILLRANTIPLHAGSLNIHSTTESTSRTTGSLQIAGGVGISKILNANNMSYGLYFQGDTSTVNNTTDPINLTPITDGTRGSNSISDEVLFSRDFSTIVSYGENFLSINGVGTGLTLRTYIYLTIDAVEYPLLDSTTIASLNIVNSKTHYKIYYKFIKVGDDYFDVLIFGRSMYELTVGDLFHRTIYAYANNGGNHFPRSSSYDLNASYQFNIASISNGMTLLHSSAFLEAL